MNKPSHWFVADRLYFGLDTESLLLSTSQLSKCASANDIMSLCFEEAQGQRRHIDLDVKHDYAAREARFEGEAGALVEIRRVISWKQLQGTFYPCLVLFVNFNRNGAIEYLRLTHIDNLEYHTKDLDAVVFDIEISKGSIVWLTRGSHSQYVRSNDKEKTIRSAIPRLLSAPEGSAENTEKRISPWFLGIAILGALMTVAGYFIVGRQSRRASGSGIPG
jgi:hypothetical protein